MMQALPLHAQAPEVAEVPAVRLHYEAVAETEALFVLGGASSGLTSLELIGCLSRPPRAATSLAASRRRDHSPQQPAPAALAGWGELACPNLFYLA